MARAIDKRIKVEAKDFDKWIAIANRLGKKILDIGSQDHFDHDFACTRGVAQ